MKSGRFALRNWRVRWRLIALIAVPTVVSVLVGALQIVDSISRVNEYQRSLEKAELSAAIAELADALELERDRAVAFVGAGRTEKLRELYSNAFPMVDEAMAKVTTRAAIIDGSHGEAADTLAGTAVGRLAEVKIVRDQATKNNFLALPTLKKYSQIIDVLETFHDEVDQGALDESLSKSIQAMAALNRAKDHASTMRALLSAAVLTGSFKTEEYDAFVAAYAQRESEVNSFKALASIDHRQAYDDTVTGAKVDRAELYRLVAQTQHLKGLRTLDLDPKVRQDADRWFDVISSTIGGMRTVEKQLSDSIIQQIQTLQDSAQRSALLAAGGSGLLLLLVLLVTTLMARSLVRPLRRLRSEALQIAGTGLPETVRVLRETGEPAAGSVTPIGVDSEDEIGEVARAFDEVHREAVRLAGEEARLRANVNAMFVNLSRRSQTLVERQITLIDGLEQGEQDEQRLGNLFKLDHLATRMRRNSENLLVLAGQEPPRRWSQPVQLVDVARASLSEVENYERVVLQVPGGVAVAGQAVNDIIHLLAELVENALSFSPRETRVTVSGSRIDGGGMMVAITDQGIGMTQEELAHANERLEHSPDVDVSVSRRMGLFVVARLAHRHGVRVQLRPHGAGGLTAMVLLPESLLGAPLATGAPSTGFETDSFAAVQAPINRFAGGPADPFPSQDPFAGGAQAPGWGTPAVPDQVAGSWPSAPQWPSDPGPSWPSEPQVATGGFDTQDPWLSSRGWNAPAQAPPEEPAPSSWSFGEPPPARRQRYDFPNPDEAAPLPRRSFGFPETESAATGPIPVVKPAAGDEFLPIFASVESAWFEQGGGDSASWGSTKADAGWTAAAAAREPVADAPTSAGLPKRVPKANLVPGSAGASAAPAAAPVAAPKAPMPMPAPTYAPDRVRSRLSSFQQGFRAARADLTEGRAYPAGPGHVESREEGQ
ncbi:nitrate- and nitrite sensing domain-containing protein [Nonomuraea sp. NPDC050663]|uniref:sensor histidine kinase n=1 Tax=Nonomuraea sp. NPDC050663 TaxID=3364370 RepID=UPI0037953472